MLASSFASIYLLAALACPVGMGLMMWFMGKGMMGGRSREGTPRESMDEQSLPTLEAEQARLAEKIAALEQRASTGHEPDARDGHARAPVEAEESERTPA